MGFDKWKLLVTPNSADEENVFYSGQTLRGQVVIDQYKEKTFRGIYVELKGYCQVKWYSEGRVMEHQSYEEYVNEKVYIINSTDGKCKVEPGQYEYPYQFEIPLNCPASYEGKYGYIRYELNLVVDRAVLNNQVKTTKIMMIAPLDLNPFPGVRNPIKLQLTKSYKSCMSSGIVEVLVKCAASGYSLGQNIPIEVLCENNSSVTIKKILFTLLQVRTYYTTQKKVSVMAVASKSVGPVPRNSALETRVALYVPKLTAINVRNCKFIDVDYYLEVTVCPKGYKHSSISKRQGMLIGTVPLRECDQLQESIPDVPPICPPSPSTCLSSQPPCSPSPPTCLPSPPTTQSSETPCLPSPATCLTSPPTTLSSETPCLPSPATCLTSYPPSLPFSPNCLPFPPTCLPSPPNCLPIPPPNPSANDPYFNGYPYPYANPYYANPYFGPSTLYPVYPLYPGEGNTHHPSPRYSLVAPSAPDAEPDTGNNTTTNN